MREKILFYSFYSGRNIRGVETFLDNLVPGIEKYYHTILIVSGKSNKVSEKTIHIQANVYNPGHPLMEKFFISRRRIEEFIFYFKGLRALFSSRPKAIVIMNCGWHLGIYRLITKIIGSKLVLVGESGLGWDDKINLFFRPDVFVALSNAQRKWALKYASKNQKIVVIPNGVNSVFFQQGKKLKLFKNDQKTVITVSAITASKNLMVLLKALELLPYNWLLLGKGNDEFLSLTQSKLGERFMNLTVPYTELPKYLSSAEVFALIQKPFEAFGNVFIEAGASGLPIVCGDDPIRREILFNQAVFVKNIDNPEEVTKAIRLAMNLKTDRENYRTYEYQNIISKWMQVIDNL